MAKKGHTNNPNGRPKGIANKSTTELRTLITNLIQNNFSNIQNDLNELTPLERLTMLEKLLKFALPPLASIEVHQQVEQISVNNDEFDEMRKRIKL